MIYFQQFYLDREKDMAVALYMEGPRLFYVIRTPNHHTGNLITNLARLCGLETTLDENGLKVIRGEIVDRQDWLCNPGRKIMPMIARLTHITDEMVADQSPVDQVIRAFAEYIGDLPLVGHNIRSSDLHYIKRAADRAGIALENAFFDTYLYAKKFKAAQGWENVKLEYLSQQFGIAQNSAHRAWCDAEANVGVYYHLKYLE